MSRRPSYSDLAPRARDLLADVRRRIRRYVLRKSLLATAAAALGAFWLLLGIDYWLESSLLVRRWLLGAAGAVTVGAFVKLGLSRLFRSLPDASLAVLVERRFPELKEALLTTIELGGKKDEQPEFTRAMLEHTARAAEERVGAIDARSLFNFAPVRRLGWIAALLATPAIVLAIVAPQSIRFGAERVVGLTDEKWPRRSRLEIEGFANGEALAARGTDFDLVVRADASMVVPRNVQVRYRTAEGGEGRKNMDREGTADDGYQVFRLNLPNVAVDYWFDVAGGDDDHLRDLHIRVVDSPAVEKLTLACEYPPYTQRLAGDVPVTGVVQLPQGTKVVVRGTANKDLVRAELSRLVEGRPASPIAWTPNAGANAREFSFTLDRLDVDASYAFALRDADGLPSRDPLRLVLSARPDEPPKIDTRREGVSGDVTPQARITIVGGMTDDYGVAAAELEFQIDTAAPSTRAVSNVPAGKLEARLQEVVEAAELSLQAGQVLTVGIVARDARSLETGEGPNVTRGERFQFNIVTPDQFRQILTLRELNLRQQFERVIAELTDARADLANLTIGPAPPAPANSQETPIDRRGSTVQRVLQFGLKNADETRSIGQAFEVILQELINNRIDDSAPYQERLSAGIAQPLARIAGPLFSAFDSRLRALQSKYATTEGEQSRQAALSQADELLREMETVRAMMLRLESYEEALALLRGILNDQQQVSKATKERKLDQLEEEEE